MANSGRAEASLLQLYHRVANNLEEGFHGLLNFFQPVQPDLIGSSHNSNFNPSNIIHKGTSAYLEVEQNPLISDLNNSLGSMSNVFSAPFDGLKKIHEVSDMSLSAIKEAKGIFHGAKSFANEPENEDESAIMWMGVIFVAMGMNYSINLNSPMVGLVGDLQDDRYPWHQRRSVERLGEQIAQIYGDTELAFEALQHGANEEEIQTRRIQALKTFTRHHKIPMNDEDIRKLDDNIQNIVKNSLKPQLLTFFDQSFDKEKCLQSLDVIFAAFNFPHRSIDLFEGKVSPQGFVDQAERALVIISKWSGVAANFDPKVLLAEVEKYVAQSQQVGEIYRAVREEPSFENFLALIERHPNSENINLIEMLQDYLIRRTQASDRLTQTIRECLKPYTPEGLRITNLDAIISQQMRQVVQAYIIYDHYQAYWQEGSRELSASAKLKKLNADFMFPYNVKMSILLDSANSPFRTEFIPEIESAFLALADFAKNHPETFQQLFHGHSLSNFVSEPDSITDFGKSLVGQLREIADQYEEDFFRSMADSNTPARRVVDKINFLFSEDPALSKLLQASLADSYEVFWDALNDSDLPGHLRTRLREVLPEIGSERASELEDIARVKIVNSTYVQYDKEPSAENAEKLFRACARVLAGDVDANEFDSPEIEQHYYEYVLQQFASPTKFKMIEVPHDSQGSIHYRIHAESLKMHALGVLSSKGLQAPTVIRVMLPQATLTLSRRRALR